MMRLSTLAAAVLAAFCLSTPVSALDIKGLASEVPPCVDFYGHVNGRWQAVTELPADRTRIGSFAGLRVANDALLERALQELAAKPELQTTPGLKLTAVFYASGMDLAAIEANGLKPVAPLLARIDTLAAREQLPALLAAMNRLQIAAPLGAFVAPDVKNTQRHVLVFSQNGLGLPDRDDYFKADEVSTRLRAAYRAFAERMLTLATGTAPTRADLDALMVFETQLAEASKTRVQLRDPNGLYNPFSLASLAAAAPGFDWARYLAELTGRKDGVDRVLLGSPGFAKALAQLAADAPLPAWRNYLKLRLLDTLGAQLPKAYADAHFAYRGAAVTGLKTPAPRNEDVIQAIGGRYGNAPVALGLGELFVLKAFPAEAQKRSQVLLADIKAAMREHIQNLAWMSAPTKERAIAKLDAMAPMIGAPEKWPRFDGLALTATDYAGNTLRANAWQMEQRLADLDKPVDRTRWNTSPHIVNAFAGGLNQITFPAGILQPPFFDAQADDAVNYGGIGMVIGHEITHHFDDRGRQFDNIGSLNDWWTPEDAAAYKARAERVAALYGGYEPLPGHKVNGHLTLGENISDVAGMPLAFDGLQRAVKRSGKTDKIDGYTQEQRFFLSNALIWRDKMRTEALINQLRTDGHSPARYRVLGPMSNMPAFAKAFSCEAGAPMVATDPITVW